MTFSLAQRAGVAVATIAAIGGVSFGASAVAADARPAGARAAVSVAAQPAASAARQAAPKMVSQVIDEGVVDGLDWSVTLEFYPKLPDGYDVPETASGEVPSRARKAVEDKSSLLCQRMVIGGVRIDHQGGPWADCQAVDGAHDPGPSGSAGLWGFQDKGLSGTRLFVALPQADVAHGVVTLSDGSELKGTTVTVPGTSYRAWAVAIPDGRTITAVDSYDAHHHLLDHDTNWH